MKRKLQSLCLFLVLLLTAGRGYAYDAKIGGIYYNLNKEAKTAEVTSSGNWKDKYSGDIIIPSSVSYEGVSYTVASIGNWAFSDYYTSLTEIEIPASVTSIGDGAFGGCSSLTSINVSVDNVEYASLDGCLYSKALDSLITCPAGKVSVTIPASVTSIGYSAFYGCSSLTEIEIPASVTSIRDYAFYGCSSLTEIEIPASVTGIGDYAFCGCISLTEIEIPASVTWVGNFAFLGCNSLTSAVISSSDIGDGAFEGCSALTSVVMHPSVTSIGDYAFDGCISLTEIEIPASVTSMGGNVFSNCYSLTSAVISSSEIGESAFWNCYALASVVMHPSVTSIGGYAFDGCISLTEIEIPASVTSMGGNVFSNCYSLTSAVISSSEIGDYAFWNCSALTSVVMHPSVTSIGDYAFEGCTSLTSIDIPSSVTSIGGYAFYCCISLTEIEIPASVTWVGNSAFGGCNSLASAVISSSEIGEYAFWDCSALTSVVMHSSVTSIGYCAFEGCTSLTSIDIPSSVTSFGGWAFSRSALTSVVFPSSLSYIDIFRCDKLHEVFILSPLLLQDISSEVENIEYIYAHKSVIDQYENWWGCGQFVELSPLSDVADALDITDTEVSFRLRPAADDGTVVQTLYYKGEPLEPDASGTYRLTGLRPDVEYALSADVLRNGVQERAGFYVAIAREPVTYTYTLSDAGCGTLMLPFDALVPEGLMPYTCTGLEGNMLVLEEQPYIIRANVPLIMYGEPGTYVFCGAGEPQFDSYTEGLLTGVYTPVTLTSGYVLQNQNGVTGFYPVSSGAPVTVPAHRCYLQCGETYECLSFRFGTTGVSGVEGAVDAAPWYDLQGRRVEKPTRGLYIHNHKKVFIK